MQSKGLPSCFPALTTGPVLQLEDTARTDRCANTAANAGRAHDILASLRVSAYIDAHFTIGGTVAARDALTAICSNPEPREKALEYSQVSSHGATKTAPDPCTKNGIEPHPDHTGEEGPDEKAIPAGKLAGNHPQYRPAGNRVDPEQDRQYNDYNKNTMN